jgi:hypothetical protein
MLMPKVQKTKDLTDKLHCPVCSSISFVKKGKSPITKKQQYKCSKCKKLFIENPDKVSSKYYLPKNITPQEMFDYDIWDVKVLGKKPATNGQYTLKFTGINFDWLKLAAKKWIYYRAATNEMATLQRKLETQGNPGGNPDILMATAEAKKKDALERTEKAIAELIKSGENITFKSVAKKAGVSVPYLYKYDELKERIQHLREQQKKEVRKRSKKPQSFQPASDQSKAVLIYNLKEENKRLREEINQQKRHIEIVQGKLYESSIVGQENQRLKQQLEKVTTELNLTKAELDRYLLSNPAAHPKVPSIDVKRKTNNSIDKDELKSKISHLGIKMNAKLYEIIKTKSETDIDNAINAVEEYIATGKKVNSKAGLFRKALEENWMPNLTDEERKIANISDDFSEWFKLAKEQGIVQASQGTKEGIIVLEPTGQWTLLSTMLEKGWTLEYLQQRSER